MEIAPALLEPAVRRVSSCRNQLSSGFQLALFWSTTPLAVEGHSRGEEQLLEPLPLLERRLHPEISGAGQNPRCECQDAPHVEFTVHTAAAGPAVVVGVVVAPALRPPGEATSVRLAAHEPAERAVGMTAKLRRRRRCVP
jgi:hypothetical protein